VGQRNEISVVVYFPKKVQQPLVTIKAIHSIDVKLSDLSPLEMQKRMLEMNPDADYILWGTISAPDVPHAVYFADCTTCVSFRVHRRRLFLCDEDDIDSLPYLLMALMSALRQRRDYSIQAIQAQFEREFGHNPVQNALSCIRGKRYIKDGKEMAMCEIPTREDEEEAVLAELSASGRFPGLL